LLEHHPDAAAHNHRLDAFGVNVFTEKADVSFDARFGDQIVHAVQRTEKGGFPATARTNDSRDGARANLHRNTFEHLPLTERDGKIFYREGRRIQRSRASGSGLALPAKVFFSRCPDQIHAPLAKRSRVSTRTLTLISDTSSSNTNAPAHACRCQSS